MTLDRDQDSTLTETSSGRPSLVDRLPPAPIDDADEILDRFIDWVGDVGFELYPAQEEALLEIMAGRHVILNTPTGSGKSLVALGMHFKALCEGRNCFYTSPVKALASEKFFDLCDLLGPDRVGMQTGDASINPKAPIICATAEVVANRALRQGESLEADYVVMDEFHYYGDLERGTAWQVPLVTLPRTTFLLMSATLGNTAPIAERLERDTGRKVSLVYSDERPVPLDYDYRETPLHETVRDLVGSGKTPAYVVSFTQRECAELAQSFTGAGLTEREERMAIREAIGDFRFDTPYGKELKRVLAFGAGVHHAGLLPKYRLLVEQLAQKGLLKVICGTDTLGVGVNIPIRTVLFTKLAKYDGQKVGLLKVRDFKQIAGRAGRKGFDDQGSVVCQAPDDVIEARRATDRKKRKKVKRPQKGEVSWNRQTFEALITRPPEMLKSRFRLTHGMILDLLQRDAELNSPERRNFDSLRELIARCHEPEGRKGRLLKQAAVLVRSLHRAGVLTVERDTQTDYWWVTVAEDLQWDFSLFQALALYLVEAITEVDPENPDHSLEILSLTEAILENPRVVLYRQVDRARRELVGQLKAQGMPYEERMERLDQVSYPKPSLPLIESTFAQFRQAHPWVSGEDIHPKSIGRDMLERYCDFSEYVRHYGLERSEGVLLRYISQLYKTLAQTVPERAKTEAVYDAQGFFRAILDHTDTSLIEEWESMLHPELLLDRDGRDAARRELKAYELFHDPRAFRARVRAELHQVVRLLAAGDYGEAAAALCPEPGQEEWTAERLEEAVAPFLEEHGRVVFDGRSRQADMSRVAETGPRSWDVSQTLVGEEGASPWALHARIALRDATDFDRPLLRLLRIGP